MIELNGKTSIDMKEGVYLYTRQGKVRCHIGDTIYNFMCGECIILSFDNKTVVVDCKYGERIFDIESTYFSDKPCIIESNKKITSPIEETSSLLKDSSRELEILQETAYENHEYPEPWLGFDADMACY